MNTGEWLDRWLKSKIVTPRTLEKYSVAAVRLKEAIQFTDLTEITSELVDKATKGDPGLRSVLSMALDQAVKTGLLTNNVAAVKREQRRPQEGSLYYRANRRAWVAQVTFVGPDGRLVKRTKLVKVDRKTKNPPEEAVRALEELKSLRSGGGLLKSSSNIEELMTEWLASRRVKGPTQGEGLARATFAQYESISKHQIIPMLGKIKTKDLTRVKVDRWLRDLEHATYAKGNGEVASYSLNTLRLCRIVLGQALQWAMREGIVVRNAAREASPPGGRPQGEKHTMNESQAMRLIESSRGTRYGALWALLVTVGLRRGEALGLRWRDFDGETIMITSQLKLENGKIVRGDLKTKKSKRRLRLPDFLIEDLETHREMQCRTARAEGAEPPELMFTTSNGGPIRPDNLRARFIWACKEAGLELHEGGKPWTVHELRHTAASQLLTDHVPVHIVSDTLGHSTRTITLDSYSHSTDQDSGLSAESMDKRYGKNRDRSGK